MSACSRFEDEGLLALERGDLLAEHFETCEDCIAARREYDRLKLALSRVRSHVPHVDWESRIGQAISERRSGRRWMLAVAAIVTVGLAGAAFHLAVNFSGVRQRVALHQEIEPGGGTTQRGRDLVQPGDLLVLRATTGDSLHAEIRVYHNDRLAARVARESGETEIRAQITLDGVGSYQPVLLTSDTGIPPPRADLDTDAGVAIDAGAAVMMGAEIEVR